MSIEVIRRDPSIPAHIREWTPKTGLGFSILKALQYVPAELAQELIERISRYMVAESALGLTVFRRGGVVDGPVLAVEELGIVSRRVVTDAGVGFIVDAFQNATEVENMKFHGIGTGSTAEAASQTALVTELTTQYNPDNTRATGSLTEGASANIFRTVGTNTVDATASITEHAILSQAATGGGTMLDRSVFTAVALASGDSLQSTYDLTFTSGG